MSLETKEKIGKTMKKMMIENWKDPEFRLKYTEGIRKQWINSESRRKHLVGLRNSSKRPNRAEERLLSIVQPLGFRYIGDGSVVLAGKCPDFWNGDHKVIELFGDYWHRGEDPQGRIDLFKAQDYDILIVWEHELSNVQSLLQRVSEFVKWGI